MVSIDGTTGARHVSSLVRGLPKVQGLTAWHFLCAILVSVILLPWIRVSSAAPEIRPEWLLLVIALLTFHTVRRRAVSLSVVAWSAALIVGFLISTVYGAVVFNVDVGPRDLYECFKPLLYLLLYIFVASRSLSVNELRQFLRLALVVLSAVGVLSIIQYFAPETIRPILVIYTDPERISQYVRLRATGTMGNANDLGILFVFGFALALFTRRYRLFGPTTASGVLVIMLCGIVAAGSRTAFVCMLLVTLYYFYSEVKLSLKTVIIVVAASIALFKVCSLNLEILRKPIERYATLGNMSKDNAWMTRVYTATKTLSDIRQSVLVGHGPDKIGFIWGANVDNEYILVLYRYGIVGVFLLTGYFYALWRQSQTQKWSSVPILRSYSHFATAILLAGLLFAYTAGIYQIFRLMTLLILFLTIAAQTRLDSVDAKGRIPSETAVGPKVGA